MGERERRRERWTRRGYRAPRAEEGLSRERERERERELEACQTAGIMAVCVLVILCANIIIELLPAFIVEYIIPPEGPPCIVTSCAGLMSHCARRKIPPTPDNPSRGYQLVSVEADVECKRGSAVLPINTLHSSQLRVAVSRAAPTIFTSTRCETPESVDENGDENGLRGENSQSSTVLVAVLVHRNGERYRCGEMPPSQ